MKTYLSFNAIFFIFVCNSLFSQILNDSVVPNYFLTNWPNAGLIINHPISGFSPEIPTTADNIIIIDPYSTLSTDQQIYNALHPTPSGTTIIFFPGGVYELSQPIHLTQSQGYSNVVFQGAGAGATILRFNVGKDTHCFFIEGQGIGDWEDIDADIPKKSYNFSCTSPNFNGSPENWVRLRERTYPTENSGVVGQISQLTPTTSSPNYVIKDEAAKDFQVQYNLEARVLNPIVNIGIENLCLERVESEEGAASNIQFTLAVNCWVKGVYSKSTPGHHIRINQSAHVEISGCFFYHALSHDEGSYGYGVTLGESSTNCLIENNIFKRLRHSIASINGANSSVIAYNYSYDQYSINNNVPWPDSDICLHGNMSYSNLYEYNYVEEIEADDEHMQNGPYNLFFRNRTSRDPVIHLEKALNNFCGWLRDYSSINRSDYILGCRCIWSTRWSMVYPLGNPPI